MDSRQNLTALRVRVPKVTILVWHTPTGKIVAVGEPVSDFEITFAQDKSRFVIVTEVEKALVEDLHRAHAVDIENGILIPRP